MTTIRLESLELSPEELDRAKETVRLKAYEAWQLAGRPSGDGLEYWLQARRAWIETSYVPHRGNGNGESSRGVSGATARSVI